MVINSCQCQFMHLSLVFEEQFCVYQSKRMVVGEMLFQVAYLLRFSLDDYIVLDDKMLSSMNHQGLKEM